MDTQMQEALHEALNNYRDAHRLLSTLWSKADIGDLLSEDYPFDCSFDDLFIKVDKWVTKHTKPAPREFLTAVFTIDDEIGFEGYYHPKDTWNGWFQPYFTKHIADKVINEYMKGAEEGTFMKWFHSPEDQDFILYRHSPEDDVETIEPITADINGESVMLYPMGLGWVWDMKRDRSVTYFENLCERLKDTDGSIYIRSHNIEKYLTRFHEINGFMKIEAMHIEGNKYKLIVLSGG